jgi:hypothetical protein
MPQYEWVLKTLYYSTSTKYVDINKLIEIQNRLAVRRGWVEKRMRSHYSMGAKFLFAVMEKFQKQRQWLHIMNVINATELYT